MKELIIKENTLTMKLFLCGFSVSASVKEEEDIAKAPVPEGMSSLSKQAVSTAVSEHATSACNQSVSPEAPLLSPTTPALEQVKACFPNPQYHICL